MKHVKMSTLKRIIREELREQNKDPFPEESEAEGLSLRKGSLQGRDVHQEALDDLSKERKLLKKLLFNARQSIESISAQVKNRRAFPEDESIQRLINEISTKIIDARVLIDELDKNIEEKL